MAGRFQIIDRIVKWPGKAGRRRYYIFAVCTYVATLVLMLFRDTAPYDAWWETLFLFPAIGVLIATVLLLGVYEIFAMTLPMLLDMLRTFVRLLLPHKYAAPLSAAMTRWWGRMPAWMRDGTWLMPDDEPFEPKSKRSQR